MTLWLGEGMCLPSHVNLQRGDSVVISTDTEVAVATGCLIEITSNLVTVSTDRNIKNWTRSTAVFLIFDIYFCCIFMFIINFLDFTLGQVGISRWTVFCLF